MTVREQVLAAASPKDALLVLADAIDGLPTGDGWGSWESEPLKPAVPTLTSTREGADDLGLHSPGQEVSEYDGATGEPLVGGPFTDMESASADDIEFPLPSNFQKANREKVLEHLGFENLQATDEQGNRYNVFPPEGPSEEELAKLYKAYIDAGPVWLYLENRDHVLELPQQVRQMMITDINDVDPKYAYHFAKDVLMHRDQQTAETGLGLDTSGENV